VAFRSESGICNRGKGKGDGELEKLTFVLWIMDSGTMGLIWSSRSDSIITVWRNEAQGLVFVRILRVGMRVRRDESHEKSSLI